MKRTPDLLEIIEAAYAVDGSDEAWFAGLAESVHANVPFPVSGVVVNGYDISDPERPELSQGLACASDDVPQFIEGWGELVKVFETDPARTRASYGTLDEGFGLEIPVPGSERLASAFRRLGVGDVYGVNGRNPSGEGVFIGIVMPPRFAPLPVRTRRTFARIARHVAAGHRLRRRLARRAEPSDALSLADAVLDRDGRVEHAAGDAREGDALEALRRSVVAVAAARGRKRHDPERAIAGWKALVDARWSIVDHFSRDGSQYLVAHRNDHGAPAIGALTEREREVVALAAMGHSNKAIAYDLGIATSTVGVLVSRALKRLGLRSRRELRDLLARRFDES